ncbi:MAG: nuclear transport factor 2 family protein [Planctomycetota bacterium]
MKDADWVGRVFAAVDAMDTEAFLNFFEDDARFRFGSAPAVTGQDAIRRAVEGFFASIGGLRHEILETWFEAETVICRGQVTYTRTDGSEVAIPFATIWKLGGERIEEYLIYTDINSLFSAVS